MSSSVTASGGATPNGGGGEEAPTTIDGWRREFNDLKNVEKPNYDALRNLYTAVRTGFASDNGGPRDALVSEIDLYTAAMPRTLGNKPMPMQSFPLPLPLRLVQDDTKQADPNKMPDRLEATLKNADPEKNPPLAPWNYWRNPLWNSTFTLEQVAGAADAQRTMRTALIDPYRAANYFPESLATRGIMLYGVAGTGKTTISTAAVNALSTEATKDGRVVVDPRGFRSEAEVAALVANPKLPEWAIKYWGVEAKGKKGSKSSVATTYKPNEARGEQTLFRSHSHRVDDPDPSLAGVAGGALVHMTPVPRVIFFQVTVADIKSVWVGESARRLERWFELAQACAPSILFFDEAETYLNPEDEHNSDAITTFKQQFGGLSTKSGVTLIVATNYPMRIEPAIRSRLAAGSVEVGLPNMEARRFMIGYEIDRAFRPSMLRPDRYVQDRERVIDFVAARTRPPFSRQSKSAGSNAATQKQLAVARKELEDAQKRRRELTEGRTSARTRDTQVKEVEGQITQAAALVESLGEEVGGSSLWSGRDLKALVIFGLSNARSRLLAGNARVKMCNSESGDKACKDYEIPTGVQIYVPGDDSPAGTTRKMATTTKTVIDDGNGDMLQPAPVTLLDFERAFATFSGSVDPASVRDQLDFNKERGFDSTNASDEAQNWVNWYASADAAVRATNYDDAKRYPFIGANTTVPSD